MGRACGHPGFPARRPSGKRTVHHRRAGPGIAQTVTAEASEDSIAAAAMARTAVDAIYAVVEENKEYLGRIDAIAGDGDHGIGMSRGSKAAAEAANETQGGVETVLSAAGHAFGDRAGGTSGILWGLLLEGVGKGLGNTEAVTAKRLADAVQVRPRTCSDSARPRSATRPCWTPCSRSSIRWSGRLMPGLQSPKRGARRRRPVRRLRRQPHRLFRRSGGRGRWQSAALAPRIRARSRSA